MIAFLAFFDQKNAVFIKICTGKYFCKIRYFYIIDRNTALCYQSSCFRTVLCKFGIHQKCQDIFAFFQLCCRVRSSRDICGLASLYKQCSCSSLCFLCFFFAMYDLCDLVCQYFFCLVDLCTFQCTQSSYFFHRKEGQKS